MRLIHALPAIAIAATLAVAGAKAQTRAKADVTCAPTAKPLVYDCSIELADAAGAPLAGVDVTVGADMPSMPMAHNVRPVKGEPGAEPGLYRARLELEMHGDWALRIDLSGAIRDRIVKPMRFEAPR
jgi:hypothetical protein